MNWKYKRGIVVALVAALALGLAACGGGDDDTTEMMCPEGQVGTYPDCSDPPAPPTPYETASAAIAAATTAADAQAAYDAVKDDVTATQGDMLQMKVNERIAAIEMAARVAEQKMALMTAAGMIDTSDLSTQDAVDAANEAIRGLRQALEDAADVSDADKEMYMSQLDDAVDAVDMAQGGIDTATRRSNQMMALSDASGDLQDALAALSGATPTQALLDAANNALMALNNALTGGADLTETEKAPYQREADNAAAPIQMAQSTFDDAEDEDEKAKAAMMAATAAKLYSGLEHGLGDTTNVRTAAYGADANADDIVVTVGTVAATLSEDEDAMVGDRHGWTGMKFTHTVPKQTGGADNANAGDMYEAVVYSNVGEPTEGAKFSATYTYDVTPKTAGGSDFTELNITGATAVAARIASPRFDQDAGTKSFKLPDNNVRIPIPGSYHGVDGTYYCTVPKGGSCTATIVEGGFTLAGVAADGTTATTTWTFKATNADTRLMDTPDANYASYGWWILKAANDGDFTASAFAVIKGTGEEAAANIDTLRGTAKYVGGAAGKYALRSSTGGTNDAGHFTADATLEADFNDDMITGTINNFIGADGQSRNWSVELMEQGVGATGTILGDNGTGTVGTDEKMTKWTIDGTAADADGQWSGTLYDNDDGGVPQIGTGTFESTYGEAGRMVGAFGVNKQ